MMTSHDQSDGTNSRGAARGGGEARAALLPEGGRERPPLNGGPK
jgi:hypothetical protein